MLSSTLLPMVISASIFAIASVGVVVRRNPIVMFMCIELMMNAVNLMALTLARNFDLLGGRDLDAPVLVLMLMVLAAAEAVIGLAIITNIYRDKGRLDVDLLESLK